MNPEAKIVKQLVDRFLKRADIFWCGVMQAEMFGISRNVVEKRIYVIHQTVKVLYDSS